MKKIFFVLATILCCSLSIKAQGNVDAVYLKNGDVVYGEIVAHTPNKFLKIRTQDGETHVFLINEVSKVDKQFIKSSQTRSRNYNTSTSYNSYTTPKEDTGYRGFVDFGYSFGIGKYKSDRMEISTSHGYQFDPYFYLGGGLGLSYFNGASMVGVSFFANPRVTLPTDGLITPFADLKIGYTVNEYVEGFYLAPSVGMSYKIRGNQALNLSLGYTLQKVEGVFNLSGNYYGYNYDIYYTEKINIGAITFKVGFQF